MTFIPVFVSQSDLGDPMGVNAHKGSTFRRGLVCKSECPLCAKSGHSPDPLDRLGPAKAPRTAADSGNAVGHGALPP